MEKTKNMGKKKANEFSGTWDNKKPKTAKPVGKAETADVAKDTALAAGFGRDNVYDGGMR